MPREPQIIPEFPHIENTVTAESFRSQYPARYSLVDNDKLVLHAGALNCHIQLLARDEVQLDPLLSSLDGGNVDLYVLESHLVLWIQEKGLGLKVPYPLIALHALGGNNNPIIHLEIVLCGLIRFTGHGEHFFNATFVLLEGLGDVLRPNSPITKQYTMVEIYEALSKCSGMHADSESSGESFAYRSDVGELLDTEATYHAVRGLGAFGKEWLTAESLSGDLEVPETWLNSGDADDLGMEIPELDPYPVYEAGMNVDVGDRPLVGVRKRDGLDAGPDKKSRRV